MKKLLPILIVGILFLSGLGVVALSDGNKIKQKITTINFSQPLLQERSQYITIDIDETNSFLIKPNKPLLPSYIHTFTFPFGTKIKSVECTPSNIQQQYVSKKIMPSPEPVLAGHKIIQAEKSVSYDNYPYPNTWYEYDIGCGIKNNERCIFVTVQAFPVQYIPSENMVKIAGDFKIDIKYEEPSLQTVTFDEEYEFIILAPLDFSSSLDTLVTHKNDRNISTKFVSLSYLYGGVYFPVEGRDDPEKIKYFIKNAIENWNTSYVLLVGGDDEFPIRATHVLVDYFPDDPDDEEFVSDLYYADIYHGDSTSFSSWDSNGNDIFGEYNWGSSHSTDDVDLYPDIYLGRLACRDSNEVAACINKIITYETNEAYTKDWFTNFVVIGGDTSPHDDENIDEGEYVNQAIIDIMDGFIPNKIWGSNGRLGGVNPTGVKAISDSINEGCGFVDFSGHGADWVWTTYPHNGSRQSLPTPTGLYRSSDIQDLENGDKLPVVITGACSVGKFNSNPECFTWSFVLNPNGGGIGSFGPSGLSWGYDTSYCIQALGGKMQVNLFKGYKQYGAYTFGEMWTEAISNYITPGMDCGDYKTVEQWQPFGDPTLVLRGESSAPVKPDVPEGPTSGAINTEYTYTTSTTDPDGDELYYLFDWSDDTYSEWVGPYESGETTEAIHTWTEKGDYEIRVKAKDERGVQSEWSDPLPISMPKNKAINSPFLQFLENHPHMFPLLQQLFGLQ